MSKTGRNISLFLVSAFIIINGCKKEPELPPLELKMVTKDASGFGKKDGAVYAIVNGGISPYIFEWSTGDTARELVQAGAGQYWVIVMDAKGQKITDTALVNQPSPDSLAISLDIQHVTHHAGCDGAITLAISGGIPPYQATWSTGDTSTNLLSIPAGLYTVKVTDTHGHVVFDSARVTQPLPKSLQVSGNVQHVSVSGGSNGSIDITVSGGYPPYQFEWSNGSVNEDIKNIASGTYSITVTDNQENTITENYPVLEPGEEIILLSFDVTHESGPGAMDGSIILSVSGGVSPYTYTWSDGSVTKNISSLTAGAYRVTVTGNNNITSIDSATVSASPLKDIDGNTYTTVEVGSQMWMKENLRVTKAPDGSSITSYCYNDDPSNCDQHGRLYPWHVAMNDSTAEGAQGICPDGWHIPTDQEWKTLEIALGMSSSEADAANTWRGTGQGTQLLSGGSSGMEILLSGRRNSNGTYSYAGSTTYIWTSTESSSSYAWRRCLGTNSSQVGRYNTFPKTYGFSVRCIKD